MPAWARPVRGADAGQVEPLAQLASVHVQQAFDGVHVLRAASGRLFASGRLSGFSTSEPWEPISWLPSAIARTGFFAYCFSLPCSLAPHERALLLPFFPLFLSTLRAAGRGRDERRQKKRNKEEKGGGTGVKREKQRSHAEKRENHTNRRKRTIDETVRTEEKKRNT